MLGLGGLAQACNGIKLLFTLHTAAGLWISELALNELPEEPGPGCEEGERSLRWGDRQLIPAAPAKSAEVCPTVWVGTGSPLPTESWLVVRMDLSGREQFK